MPNENAEAPRHRRDVPAEVPLRVPHRRSVELVVGHKAVQVAVAEDGALELWLDGCLRKRRAASARMPLYVWTNVELHWEEHRYVEARYWPDRGELQVTVNRETAYAGWLR